MTSICEQITAAMVVVNLTKIRIVLDIDIFFFSSYTVKFPFIFNFFVLSDYMFFTLQGMSQLGTNLSYQLLTEPTCQPLFQLFKTFRKP